MDEAVSERRQLERRRQPEEYEEPPLGAKALHALLPSVVVVFMAHRGAGHPVAVLVDPLTPIGVDPLLLHPLVHSYLISVTPVGRFVHS